MNFEYLWSILTQSLWRTFSIKKVFWEEKSALGYSSS